MTRNSTPPPAVFVSDALRGMGWLFGGVFACLGLVLALVIPEIEVKAVVVFIHAAVSAFFFGRYARAGLYISQSGVKIVRLGRTILVPWDQADRFVVGPRGLMQVAHLKLRSGETLWIEGIGGRRFRPPEFDSDLHARIIEMNEALKHLRPSP